MKPCITRIVRFGAALASISAIYAQASVTYNLAQVVNKAMPRETLTPIATQGSLAAAGSIAQFTVALTGAAAGNAGIQAPTGTVTYTMTPSGGTPVSSTVPVNSASSVWTATIPASEYTVTATYSGDAHYLPLAVTYNGAVAAAPSFDFTVSDMTVKQGQSVAADAVVATTNGFDQPITFTCAPPSSANINCTFANPTLKFQKPAAAGSSSAQSLPFTVATSAGQFIAVSGLLCSFFLVRRRRSYLAAAIATLLCGFAIVGCGTSGKAGWQSMTPKGTYTATVTGTAGSLSVTKQFTVTVQ